MTFLSKFRFVPTFDFKMSGGLISPKSLFFDLCTQP